MNESEPRTACPTCGAEWATVYRYPRSPRGYCSTCKRTHALKPRRTAEPKPERKPRPKPRTYGGDSRALTTERRARIRAAVLRRDRHVCRLSRDGQRCGRIATVAHHLAPISNGGTHRASNIVAACAECSARAYAYTAGREKAAPAWPTPRQREAVELLDALSLASDVGRRSALKTLARLGIVDRPGPRTLDVACAWRRARARGQLVAQRAAVPVTSREW